MPGPLFRSMRGTTTGTGATANGLYTIVAQWARVAGIEVERLGVHGLRATAATNALEHDTDIEGADVAGVREHQYHPPLRPARPAA
ncbi:Phage integrase family site specific recombinase [Pseudomonas amygdali pv. mori]|uniref:Orf28 n=2 Tax=Pseudomonas amygdali pv. mori TaxID=34065 RepID=A0A3M4LPP2_PSEA0|nr:Phage integrase [Pseudomonas amygdali pv. mori]RMR43970.1 Phage integrase family site specific recombinase [Pseudomonas amygdali pv. mori]RMT18366.1 Orf28 [Pseudomonas amygdali pv. mori]